MKIFGFASLLAVVSFAMAPLAAHSQDSSTTQACVDAFVAQNFPGQTPIVKVDRTSMIRVPLVFAVSAQHLKLTAANRASGNVLVSATCTEKKGVITLTLDQTKPVIIPASIIASL